MNKATASLKEQSAWLLLAKLVGFGFAFLLPLIIVRYLPREEVGHYREAFLFITNAVIILPLGFSMSAYYFLARETSRRSSAILNILLFNFVVGGLACLLLYLFPQALGYIFRDAELTRLAPKIGVVVWIWVFSTFLETVAVANQEARTATMFIVVAQFSKTLLMGIAVFAVGTVDAFIYAAMIQGALQTLILCYYLGSRFPGLLRSFDPSFFREQMVYAVPFGLTGILWIAQNDIHSYFAAHKFAASEYAIYAYGCFQIPLIMMLAESVTSVLLPRMNELQLAGDKDEMIRLTLRAMQKLALLYFPVYVFLMVTADTFVLTLFTKEYAASASVLVINITILPFSILITDPVVRSFKELGRFFLLTRIVVLSAVVSTFYLFLDVLNMQGMIAVGVGAILLERLVAESMVIRKLGLKLHHLGPLRNVGKTAVIILSDGALTYVVYSNVHIALELWGEHFAEATLATHELSTLNFIGGSLVLFTSAIVFAPVYLGLAWAWGVIEKSEIDTARRFLRKLSPRRTVDPLREVGA